MTRQTLWGIDLGGTKTEGVVLQAGDDPKTIARLRIPTERKKGYEHIINQIKKLVSKMEKETSKQPHKIGIGIPGTLEPSTQTVKNANTTVLNGRPFKEDLEKALGLPVILNNDANCFALAEAKFGIVKMYYPEAVTIFGVIMGTGVGGGIIIKDKILTGKQGIGGEWGHNFLDESGGKCYCGKTGCVETVISGPALEKYYSKISGKEKSLKEINQLYENGSDQKATETIMRLCKFFGKAIAQVINIIDPSIIILGGGVGNIQSLYTIGFEETKKHVFNNKLGTHFVSPKLGDSAGVIGAAYLVNG
ncbi:MAG: ROK family protein [Bacteroidales bacterium]